MEIIFAFGVMYLIYWTLNKIVNSASKPVPPKRRTKSQYKSNHPSSSRSNYGSKNGPYSPRPSTDTGVPIKNRYSPAGNYRPSGRKQSDFRYLDNPNPDEFLVYLIASEELNALKIGVGTSGRVLQLMTSTTKTEDGITNVGWKVLKTAKFSNSFDDYETGRTKGYEAERRVLYYWRKHLGLSSFVSEEDMGWSELYYKDSKGWHRTKGYTETVEMTEVCEESTWNIVINSPGYIGEGSSFFQQRDLRSNPVKGIDGKVAKGYFEYKRNLESSGRTKTSSIDPAPAGTESILKPTSIPLATNRRKNNVYAKGDGTDVGRFWARVKKNPTTGCWEWQGSLVTDTKYGTILWNNTPKTAHRVAWELEKGSDPGDAFLLNKCGLRSCVNPDHWELHKKTERKCLTDYCEEISLTKIVDGYCQKCHDRRKRERRRTRGYKYSCSTNGCGSPSPTQTHRSKCANCVELGK